MLTIVNTLHLLYTVRIMDRTPNFESLYDSAEDEERKKKDEKDKEEQAKEKRLSLLERLSAKDEGEEKVTLKGLFEEKSEKDSKKAKSEEDPDTKADNETTDDETDRTIENQPGSPEVEAAVSEIMQEHIEERLTTLNETVENSPEGSVEHAQAQASKELLEAVDERLRSGEEAFNPVVEGEFQRLKDEALTKLSEQEGNEELAPEDAPRTEAQPIAAMESTPEDNEDPTPSPPAPMPAARGSTTPTPAPTAASGGSSSGTPPPTPSGGSGSHGGGTGSGGSGNYSPPPARTPESGSAAHAENSEREKERSKRGQDLLAGGVVGYMIGRRGGRKRAEARLNPKIEELETEVAAAKKNLSEKERKLQKIVAASFRRPEIAPTEQKPTAEQRPATAQPETPEHTQPKPVREVLRRAVEVPAYLQNTELGSKAETQTAPQTTKQEVINAKVKRLETLSTPEILAEAQSFYAGGTNVRRLYETNQIDRKGLIYLVKEGYRGKDLRKAFERVELGRERQRERAREFRHDDPGFTAGTSDNQHTASHLPPPTAHATLPNQPDQSSVEPITPVLPPLNIAANETKTAPDTTPAAPVKQQSSRPYITVAVVGAISIALLILWALL